MKMGFHRIGPQEVGTYGPDTKIVDRNGKRTLVFLDIAAETEPDDIVSISFYYAVSKRLRITLESHCATGVSYRPASMKAGENLLARDVTLEGLVFYELVVTGEPYQDDFGVLHHYLVVSDRALFLIKSFDVNDLHNYDESSPLDLLPEI